MKPPQFRSAFARFVIVLAILALPSYGANAQQTEREARVAGSSEDIANSLTQELGLTPSQAALIRNALGSGQRSVALWGLSAELEPTLSDAQKAKLFARAGRSTQTERPDRTERLSQSERPARTERPAQTERRTRSERPVRNERLDRTERPARIERRDRAERPARTERSARSGGLSSAERDARNRALGLTEEEGRRLDELLDQRAAGNGQGADRLSSTSSERIDTSRLPSEITAFLNADQQEIFKVHYGLRAHMQGSRSR